MNEMTVRLKDNTGQHSTLMITLIVLLGAVIVLCILLGVGLHCRRYKLHSTPGLLLLLLMMMMMMRVMMVIVIIGKV